MASSKLDKLLKRRMEDTQQSSERQLADDAYEQIFQKQTPVTISRFCDLPIEKLRSFFTADIGFHPYPPSKLKAFSEQLAQDGLFERVIIRPITDGCYEIRPVITAPTLEIWQAGKPFPVRSLTQTMSEPSPLRLPPT